MARQATVYFSKFSEKRRKQQIQAKSSNIKTSVRTMLGGYELTRSEYRNDKTQSTINNKENTKARGKNRIQSFGLREFYDGR